TSSLQSRPRARTPSASRMTAMGIGSSAGAPGRRAAPPGLGAPDSGISVPREASTIPPAPATDRGARQTIPPGSPRPAGPAPVPVQVRPAPQLERHQGPQLEIEGAAAAVPIQEVLDVAEIEDPALPRPLAQEHVANEGGQRLAEPLADRNGEAVLGAVDDRVG